MRAYRILQPRKSALRQYTNWVDEFRQIAKVFDDCGSVMNIFELINCAGSLKLNIKGLSDVFDAVMSVYRIS